MNSKLEKFLDKLKEAHIWFALERYRDDAISVIVVVPGQRWEVDFLEDGSVDVERFVSNGVISGEEAFKELFDKFADRDDAAEKNTKVIVRPQVVRKSKTSSPTTRRVRKDSGTTERSGVLKNGH